MTHPDPAVMEADGEGFRIAGRTYPFPKSFRMGDPPLIVEVTGMEFMQFAESIDDPNAREDPRLLAGLLAVAIWQANPRWKRDRVASFVQGINIEDVAVIGASEDGEGGPPASPAAGDEPSGV